MNIVTVKINGIEYNLKGEEQEEYLHMVAGYVDKKVRNIIENNRKLSTSAAAVLSAVNIVDEMFKMKQEHKELLLKLDQFEKKQVDYEEQIELLKKQLKHMEEYNVELQSKLKNTTNTLSAQELEQKEEQIKKLQEEMEIIYETSKNHVVENSNLKSKNKEYKFQLQSAKYKIMDLEHKLIENQISLAKEKKQSNPLLNDKEK